MRGTDGTWEVAVRGDAMDFDYLARYFTKPPLVVAKSEDTDEFVMRLDDLAACSDSKDVLAIAERQIVVLSGLLKLERNARHPLTTGGVVRRRPDGARDIFVCITESVEARCEVGEVVMSITDAAGNPLPAPPPRAVRIAELAASEPEVNRAMRLLAAPDSQMWVGLYRTYEVVEHDVGGQKVLESRGWTPAGSIGRFKHSANSVTVAGDDARHGKETTEPPSVPMSLDEARALIDGLLRGWIESKGV